MFAFYNPETQKYMHYYPYHYHDDIIHSLDRDSTEIVFTHLDRSVLEKILQEYKEGRGSEGYSIRFIEVDVGFLDGFEIVELKHA